MTTEPILELEEITKAYGETVALSKRLAGGAPGEIHGVLGDNGAGKTTLLKLLTGLLPVGSYTGTVKVQGKPVVIHGPGEAIKHGIGIVPRRPGIFTGLTIADNVVVGKEMHGLIINQAHVRDTAVKHHGDRRAEAGPGSQGKQPHGQPAAAAHDRPGAQPRHAGRGAGRARSLPQHGPRPEPALSCAAQPVRAEYCDACT